MTGQPTFTFRGREENPECRDCNEEMVFLEEREGAFNERDVYACKECGTTFQDRWSF
ncbi:MAG: hypothetical protein SVS85_02860 [Candidatus Nanohaloarchaea archaeon]|nr:hypothetical protein [Candidatus Nanohaloarchaea archaeon]